MKNYTWILFDADNTLFHFDDKTGLTHLFNQFDIKFNHYDYITYQQRNQQLWLNYRQGKISAKEIQHTRFTPWADQLQISALELDRAYLDIMAKVCIPLPGVKSLLSFLEGKVHLGIITNGFIQLQQQRLEHNGLKNHFELIVTSEQVGVAKPHPDIFSHALDLMGNPDGKQVLMVGDNPESDILGGHNAGLDTCWLNHQDQNSANGCLATFHVNSLSALENILRNQWFNCTY